MIFLAPQISGNEFTEKVDDIILEELETEDTVDVIVVLNEESELKVSSDEIVISDDSWVTPDTYVDEDDIEVTHTYSAVMNGFAAEVTEEALEKLENDDNVEKIYYDHVYTLALQDSVPQINASTPHGIQLNGTNLTGLGQTICVVDTGINYNHADLGGGFGSGYKVMSGWDTYDDDADPIDENGHGTHVAGIAAANGSILGVAPEAGLIAMKVFSAARSTTSSRVISGIDWCVANSSLFNISVITMSLTLTVSGDEVIFVSESDCDSYSDGGVVNASNNAAEQGIFITISAGNDGNTSGIGSPACGSNTTSVGAVNGADAMSYNRGPILDLVAPGVSINSTDEVGNNYVQMSGTSMASPHVAGAAAVLQQYAEQFESRTLTPVQIEQALNDTGTTVEDAVSGANYTRIDLYAALLSIDTTGPVIRPTNENASVIDVNSTINVTLTDLHTISTFWYNNGSENRTDTYNTSENSWFIDANWTEGEYNLTFYANDSNNNLSSDTLTLTVNTAPTIDDWLWNNATGTSNSLVNITIYENNTLNIYINTTDNDDLNYSWTINGTELNTTQNLTYAIGLQDAGVHNLTINVSDNYSETLQYWNLTVYDPFPPNWNSSDINTSANESAWTYNISIYVNNTDDDTLTYSVNDSTYTMAATGVINKTFDCNDSGNYTLNVTVSDGSSSDSKVFNIEVNESCTFKISGESCVGDAECAGGYCVVDICSNDTFYCDNDGNCNTTYGETTTTCPNDCSSGTTTTRSSPSSSGAPIVSNTTNTTSNETNESVKTQTATTEATTSDEVVETTATETPSEQTLKLPQIDYRYLLMGVGVVVTIIILLLRAKLVKERREKTKQQENILP